VFAAKAVTASASGVVMPNDFVLKVRFAEQVVQGELDGMDDMPIKVDEEGPFRFEEFSHTSNSLHQPTQVFVFTPFPTVGKGCRVLTSANLFLSGQERRIDRYQLKAVRV